MSLQGFFHYFDPKLVLISRRFGFGIRSKERRATTTNDSNPLALMKHKPVVPANARYRCGTVTGVVSSKNPYACTFSLRELTFAKKMCMRVLANFAGFLLDHPSKPNRAVFVGCFSFFLPRVCAPYRCARVCGV